MSNEKIYRSFDNIAKTIKSARSKAMLSQGQLATLTGYTRAQYISNLERGLCGVPYNKIMAFSGALNIMPYEIREAMLADVRESINAHIKTPLTDSQERTYSNSIL